MKGLIFILLATITALFLQPGSAKGVGGVDDSLVMYLPLDEEKGKKVTDFSEFNHDAEIRGGGKIVGNGAHGNCVELNGKDAIVYVKDHDAFEAEQATIEIWFKTETGSNFPIRGKSNVAASRGIP